jgi:hypothetical protein
MLALAVDEDDDEPAPSQAKTKGQSQVRPGTEGDKNETRPAKKRNLGTRDRQVVHARCEAWRCAHRILQATPFMDLMRVSEGAGAKKTNAPTKPRVDKGKVIFMR